VTELSFKGKEFVYNHHLAVPFRPLLPQADKGIGPVALDGNLIVHGDNLHALKSLLPMYAGSVDIIYIDPPYNTGNEGWSYNDNVNSPMIKEWLAANLIGIEDGLRHEKWSAMMWPRLRLLHELLADDGVIFISIDDNEAHTLRQLCGEIFGSENFISTFVWRKVDSPNDNKVPVTPDHEFILCAAKDKEALRLRPMSAPSILSAYPNEAPDGQRYRDRLLKKNGRNSLRRDRPTMWFEVTDPDGNDVFPIHENGEEACWAMGRAGVERHKAAGTLIWKKREKLGASVWEPYTREFAPKIPTRPYPSIWNDLPTMRQAKAMLGDIFQTSDLFATPKPVELIGRLLELVGRSDAIVLDSFAGSGTTAHTVLEANKRDGGNRRFILVETEDYADTLTAERVRRVISGYAFKGTQKTELLRESVNWRVLQKPDTLVHKVEAIENLHAHEYDRITKQVKDGELIVTGEKSVAERAEGLGGSFTYCTLGDPVALDSVLTGETLPEFHQLGGVLFHMATNRTLDPAGLDAESFHLGEAGDTHVWLIYRADLDWLKSADAALTLARARAFAAAKPGRKHLVFAASRYVSQKMLAEQNVPVEFVPLPFALYRIERS
jgi:adenine-specific DNA-methyltransferase